jgi:hypothetical protein
MLTGEVESNPDHILIAGKSNNISSVNEIQVYDPGLDVSGSTGNLNYTYEIKQYLPSGVTFGDPDFSGSVSVVVHIEPMETRTYDVPISNITVDGEIQGFKIAVDETEYETVSVTLQGLADSLNGIDAEALRGTVKVDSVLAGKDPSELTAGNYSADVEWTIPDRVKLKGTVSVYVAVEEE